jgi:hypothetical protein
MRKAKYQRHFGGEKWQRHADRRGNGVVDPRPWRKMKGIDRVPDPKERLAVGRQGLQKKWQDRDNERCQKGCYSVKHFLRGNTRQRGVFTYDAKAMLSMRPCTAFPSQCTSGLPLKKKDVIATRRRLWVGIMVTAFRRNALTASQQFTMLTS